MKHARHYTTANHNTYRCVLQIAACLLLICSLPWHGYAQVHWQIQSPLPNSTVGNENVLVSIKINGANHFNTTAQAQVFLDNKLASGNLKIMNNELYFIFRNPITNGRHNIHVEAYVEELRDAIHMKWEFVAGDNGMQQVGGYKSYAIGLAGTIQFDNRSEYLSGSGLGLRQEPEHTRTLMVDGSALYKNAEIPVRMFVTSNRKLATQTMNYYQVGFKNKWLTAEAGDINPNFDKLVLTGVRMRGIRIMLRVKATSLQLCYGNLNQANEGAIETYLPGSGMLPTNLVNDSQYVAPGIYKRTMKAARFETGNVRETIKFGITAFKAKDDIHSISYGLAPKENLAGGTDLSLRLFRRKVNIQSGMAFSILTNDISKGVIDKAALDTSYNIKLGFDPKDYENIITLNASTTPTSFEHNDFLSYYNLLGYADRYQRFSIEYKKIGALYTSLGNPFQRTNYEGVFINERVFLLKRKVTVGLIYQNYSNNLNGSLPVKIFTKSYRGNVYVNLNPKWPSLYFNYMTQYRHGQVTSIYATGTNDVLNNYVVNLSLNRSFWSITHNFFITATISQRDDKAKAINGVSVFTATAGVNEGLSEKLNVSVEAGKMIVSDAFKTKLSNVITYSANLDWQIQPAKYFASLSASNNRALLTFYSNQSSRMSAIGRFRYMFWRGMEVLLEGGYQPFRDQTMSDNNYDESYVYMRYSCNLGQLLMSNR